MARWRTSEIKILKPEMGKKLTRFLSGNLPDPFETIEITCPLCGTKQKLGDCVEEFEKYREPYIRFDCSNTECPFLYERYMSSSQVKEEIEFKARDLGIIDFDDFMEQ